MNGVAKLSQCGIEGHVSRHFLNEVGSMSAKDVGTEDAAFIGLGEVCDIRS